MATVTNWVDHLTASEVAGQVYPYVGTELWWVIAGIAFWLCWTYYTATGEAEEQQKLARKKHGLTIIKIIFLSGNIIKY